MGIAEQPKLLVNPPPIAKSRQPTHSTQTKFPPPLRGFPSEIAILEIEGRETRAEGSF
jgi:hypothetical protein